MLLSRMAEAVYWAGRYLERAEDMARIVAVHGETHFDLPVGEDVGWLPLLAIAGLADKFENTFDKSFETTSVKMPATAPATRPNDTQEENVVRFLLTDRSNPSSILASVEAARSNLRTARSVVPREVWEVCNDLWLTLDAVRSRGSAEASTRSDRTWVLRKVMSGCEHLNGVLWGTMRRDEALTFVRLGQQVERVDITGRVIGVRADSIVGTGGEDPYADVRRSAVLRSLAAHQPFRRSGPTRSASVHGEGADGESMLRFILNDDRFPRAVASCLGEALDLAKSLPRNESVVTAIQDAALVVAEAPLRDSSPEMLASFGKRLQSAVAQVDENVNSTFFPSATDFANLSGDDLTRRSATSRPGRSTIGGTVGKMASWATAPAVGAIPTPAAITAISTTTTSDANYDGGGSPAPSRVYRIRHATRYIYEGPVEQSYNEAHLSPRNTDRQRCVSHSIEVEPQCDSWSEHLDVYGNTVTSFLVRGGFRNLVVTATSEVEVLGQPPDPPNPVDPPNPSDRQNPADPGAVRERGGGRRMPLGPPWETAKLLLDADRLPESRQARRFRSPSRLVPASQQLADFAVPSFAAGRSVVEAALDLCSRINQEFAYDPGFTSVTTPLMEVFAHRRGVCQDFAHLTVGCLRSIGLAARYVSGYLETAPPPGGERLLGADASHAWASVFVPGWGWLDLDPTNDQVVDDTYVTVAWGRDYQDVSPLRGSVEGGGNTHGLEVEVDVFRVEPSAHPGAEKQQQQQQQQ